MNQVLLPHEEVKLIKPQADKEFCFATLALGKKYRALASLLAKDIEKYSPNTYFVVLTDYPTDFKNNPNVRAFKHRQQGVKCWHDKRFVIAKALQMFNTCIFINADMRILGEVPADIKWLPGITARSGCSIIKHNKNKSNAFVLIEDVAKTMDIDLQQAKWINEFLFIVKKDEGKEMEFLRLWEIMAHYFELNKVHSGEGNAIGLAAVKAGLPLRIDSVDWFPFFNDRIEEERIKHGQAEPNEKSMYFEVQKKLEHPHRSKIGKIVDKIGNHFIYSYRLLRLRLISSQSLDSFTRQLEKNQ